jgi:hypothetical protein
MFRPSFLGHRRMSVLWEPKQREICLECFAELATYKENARQFSLYECKEGRPLAITGLEKW